MDRKCSVHVMALVVMVEDELRHYADSDLTTKLNDERETE
jgi:hypothetical protein